MFLRFDNILFSYLRNNCSRQYKTYFNNHSIFLIFILKNFSIRSEFRHEYRDFGIDLSAYLTSSLSLPKKGFNFFTYILNLSTSSSSNLSQEWPGLPESKSKLLESFSRMELTSAVALLFLSIVSSLKFPPRVLNEFFTLATSHSQTTELSMKISS